MKSIYSYLEKQSRAQIVLLCLLLMALIGCFDYFIGPEVATSIFYVLPIAIVSWFGSKNLGVFGAVLASLTWLVTDHYSGMVYSHISILYWNALVRFGMFYIIAFLLAGFREKLKTEEEAADTDVLTGALNSRAFYKLLASERARCLRYERPLSLAFIDLDNFKHVNDTYGHAAGDALLQQVVAILQAQTRKTDVVARLGGDEFVVLLIEAEKTRAAAATKNLQDKLLNGMRESARPVTFSIGLVTFETVPAEGQQMIKMADDLMYEVKKRGKNNILHRVVGSGQEQYMVATERTA